MVGGPAMALVTSPCTYCVRLCARHQGFGVRGAPVPAWGDPWKRRTLRRPAWLSFSQSSRYGIPPPWPESGRVLAMGVPSLHPS